jgi:CHAT domain-containing protein
VIERLLITVLALAAQGNQQQPAQLRALAFGPDSVALASEIKRRPVDARELLSRLLAESIRPGRADSARVAAHNVARGFLRAFNDSFPLATVRRFERMSDEQRRGKVAADSTRRAGNTALERRGVTAAIALWHSAAKRSQSLGDTASWAAAIGNIGAGHYRSGALDSSEAYLRRAKQLADAVGDRVTSLNALSILGSVAIERGEPGRAALIYEETLGRRPSIGDWRGVAADHTNLGLIAAEVGDFDAAREHYRAALDVARNNALAEPAATALLNLANLSSSEGDYRSARAGYDEALTLYRTAGLDASAALVLHDIGLLALRRGEYAEARRRLEEALTVFVRTGTPEDLVRVRRDLAVAAAASGDLNGALTHLRRAESLLAQVPDSTEALAAIALARADIAYQLNTFGEAERQYARAQSLYRAARSAAGEAEARQGLAVTLAQRRRYVPALDQLTAVLRSQRSIGDRRPAALTMVSIALVQRKNGRADDARRSLTQALDTLRVLGDAMGEAEVLSALGDLELQAGSSLVAEEHFRRGLARVASRRAPTVQWQLHAGLASALSSRARAEAEAHLALAIEDVERLALAVPHGERRAAFLTDKWQPYADLARLAEERGDVTAAFFVTERMRSRQLLDVLARGRVAGAPAAGDTSLVSRGQDLRLRIDELTRALEDQSGATGSDLRGPDTIDSASAAMRDALATAQARYAQFLMDVRDDAGVGSMMRAVPSTAHEVRVRLARDQALLTYLVTDSTTLVFVLSRDTVIALDLGISRAALASLVDFTRSMVAQRPQAAGAGAWRPPLRRLYEHLIAPVEAAGLLVNTRRLVVVPNAELHYLPFAALVRHRRGAPDEFLIERYEVAYAPSASSWLRLQDRGTPNRRVLAMAPRTTELPGSRLEVESIRELYGEDATILTGTRASERALRDNAGQFGVIHLATYGRLNQHNPLFSFVDLARTNDHDGRLEVHEVLGLILNTRLLILSACQTALASGAVSDVPAGDDWVGLVRSFLGAGAQNVIATLWAVEDRATAQLMERLHRQLRAGQSEAAALAQAQRATLRNPATAGPFYWAGFVLVGGQSGAAR